MIAFADESERELPSGVLFVIGAAVVGSSDVDRARQTLRKLLLPGQSHLHWSKERSVRRHRIVEAIAQLGLVVSAAYQHPVAPKRRERARQRCLLELAGDLCADGIDELVIEARESRGQDRLDNATLLDAAHASIAPNLRYRHAGKLDEPLLWAADAVVGAVGMHLAGIDSTYLVRLGPDVVKLRRVH